MGIKTLSAVNTTISQYLTISTFNHIGMVSLSHLGVLGLMELSLKWLLEKSIGFCLICTPVGIAQTTL